MKKYLILGLVGLAACSPIKQVSITTIDTDFSKGRLTHKQSLNLKDLEKFHGHLCDGLAEGFLSLQYGLYALFPDSLIDRTNLRIVSKSSPCLTDAAVYLTGARYQYGTFYVSNDFDGLYILQRIVNGKTISMVRKPNTKPSLIDELGNKAIAGNLAPCDLDKLRALEEEYMRFLQKSKPENVFEVREIDGLVWQPTLKNDFIKTDILNKNTERCKK